MFDRKTGKPVWPIVERPVPKAILPGEEASPTQPIPTKPPAFDRQGITEDDLIDFTPALHAEALKFMQVVCHRARCSRRPHCRRSRDGQEGHADAAGCVGHRRTGTPAPSIPTPASTMPCR